jgi:hypothetical protein
MRASHRRILLGVVAAAIVAGLAWGAPYAYRLISMYRHLQIAARREPAAVQDWKREFGDPVQTLAAFPKREDSDSAVRLIALAKAAGVDMTRPKGRDQFPPEHDPDEAARKAIREYLDAEVTKTGGPVADPPTVVRDYLASHEKALGEVVEHLSHGEPPAWKSDVALGFEAPAPPLRGHIRLQRLLEARALIQASAGDLEGSERTMAASWSLNASIRDRPEITSQLVAISVARSQVGLLRRLGVDPVVWRERLSEHDYRASVLEALVVETDAFVQGLPPASSTSDRGVHADLLDEDRVLFTILRDAPIGDRSLSAAANPRDNPDSPGAILAEIARPNLTNAMSRAHRLIIDTELTDRVLQARMLKDRLGRWPADMPEISPTRVPGARWIYALGEGGRPTISFSRELHWESLSGLVLPTSYQPM